MTAARKTRYLLTVLACLPVCLPAHAQMTVTLSTGAPSAVPVGTPVVWKAAVSPASSSPMYRFSASPSGGLWTVLRDYGPLNSLQWTSLQEGAYNIHVLVKDSVTGATANAQTTIQFFSRLGSGTVPVVSSTANSLVALYSAPPCSAGSIQVFFMPTNGSAPAMRTSPQPCNGPFSVNFYVAGMLPNTPYRMQQQLVTGSKTVSGPVLTFRTGAVPFAFPSSTLIHPPDGNTSLTEGMLLTSFISGGALSFPGATDLAGHPLWYYQNLYDTLDTSPFLTRMTPTPSVLLQFLQGANRRQVLREVDLAGNLIRETDCIALNQQLTAMGLNRINWLSHEAVRLSNGHTLTLASTERMLYNVQGPGNVDVVGDMILDLDENFQPTWTWNAFDFLPNNRKAILGETCVSNQTCGGPLYLAPVANDWTHCNSIYYMPNDGSLILSCRNQDWVLKINYQNGTGDGSLIWTLGKDGDFAINSTDPWPWFSHQHDVEFDGTNYVLFDDGNTRISPPPIGLGSGNSRGYVLSVDESTMTATPVLLADMGSYSQWWGSAQRLSNGNYHFLNGCLGANGTTASNCVAAPQPTDQSVEVLPDGTFNYNILWAAHAYRSFRLKDLYTYVP
jgi:arylsulfate sulfotransferase